MANVKAQYIALGGGGGGVQYVDRASFNNAGDFNHVVPANKVLAGILITTTANMPAVQIADTGFNVILPATAVNIGAGYFLNLNLLAGEVVRFTGITAASTYTFYYLNTN